MNKKIGLIMALLGLAFIAKPASATLATASPTVITNVQLVAAPATNSLTIVKSCWLSNDNTLATCVWLRDGSTNKFALCAGAQANANSPASAPANMGSRRPGSISNFFGEELRISGVFNIQSSTPTANVTVTCSYEAAPLN